MKRNIIAIAVLSIISLQLSVCMAQPKHENGEKRAERMADEFKLDGEKRTQFIDLFKAYRTEMRQLMDRPQHGRKNFDKKADKKADKKDDKKFEKKCDEKCDMMCDKKDEKKFEKKELTDEQAQKMLDSYFKHQKRQIERQQKKMEIERRYYGEFQKVLTAKQMLRLFHNPHHMQQMPKHPMQNQGMNGGPTPHHQHKPHPHQQ